MLRGAYVAVAEGEVSEMVERVARMLDGERDDNPSRVLIGDDGTRYPAGVPTWKKHAEHARDIIAAMRDHDEILVRYAGVDGRRDWQTAGAWLYPGQAIAVIDEALK